MSKTLFHKFLSFVKVSAFLSTFLRFFLRCFQNLPSVINFFQYVKSSWDFLGTFENVGPGSLLSAHFLCIVVCKTQRNEAGELSTDYLIKWQGLPYSCSTEEDGMLIDRLCPKAVDEYNCRLRSACTPNKLCRV